MVKKKEEKDAFSIKLGLRIKKLRENLGYSQEYLAHQLGVHRVALTQIESAQRQVSAAELVNLSKLFGVSTDVLLNLKQDIEVILEKAHKSKPAKSPEMRINVPQKKLDKFKEVLLYILSQVGSRTNVGETVIYKLLYFIDFDFYEKYEEQLIGATYIKNSFGPTPVEFKKIVAEMIDRQEIVALLAARSGFEQKKYLPKREPDLSKLTAHEVKLIDEVLERLGHMGARQISEYSHGDIPWATAEDQEEIDYESVFYRTPQYSVRNYDGREGAV